MMIVVCNLPFGATMNDRCVMLCYHVVCGFRSVYMVMIVL